MAFLAGVQHALRTPTNTIIGYAELLLQQQPDNAGSEELHYIAKAGRHLLSVINETLTKAKLNEGVAEIDGSRICHDLKGPLHVINGYAELLLDEAGTQGGAQCIHDLKRITGAVGQLSAVIDRLRRVFDDESNAGRGVEMAADFSRLVCDTVSTLGCYQPNLSAGAFQAQILVVDDDEASRNLLRRRVRSLGHSVSEAANGREALSILRAGAFDLVFLDLIMPEMNGYQVLTELKADPQLRDLPVIVVSAYDDMNSIVRCIEMGADEYLQKTYDPILLRARLSASLEKKRLRDREREHLAQIDLEREKSDRLLRSMLPDSIADQLKNGATTVAETFPETTVLFADIVGFTDYAAHTEPGAVVQLLTQVFEAFDELTARLKLEKIKTIGDAYMLAGGLPVPRSDHPLAVTEAGLEMLSLAARLRNHHDEPLQLRIGIHSGPVVAGVIGRTKFTYDLWGDTVNVANRMESTGVAGRIQVSATTRERLGSAFAFEARGPVQVKGKGPMETYLVINGT